MVARSLEHVAAMEVKLPTLARGYIARALRNCSATLDLFVSQYILILSHSLCHRALV